MMNDKKLNTLENLEQPDSNSLSVVEAKVSVQNGRRKYNIIYADPAWEYDDPCLHRGGALRHYQTMSVENIKALPIKEITADDCVLFMWGTFPKQKEAMEVIEAWGFNYKTLGFLWIKTNKRKNINQFSFLPEDNFDSFWGMGRWTRSNAEPCFLATKGKPQRQNADVHSLIYAPIDKHSKKPEETRERIIRLMGDIPRIELFARQKADGWEAWGNEVESDIILKGCEPILSN